MSFNKYFYIQYNLFYSMFMFFFFLLSFIGKLYPLRRIIKKKYILFLFIVYKWFLYIF